jgi:tetratricopeptide (TPR) repeat protein
MGRLVLGLVCVLGLARVAGAQEEKTERARAHLKAAIAYYDEARYEDAAREMEAAYQIKPLPDLQYNLAQCYERLGRYEDAARAYETYLRQSSAALDRKLVETRIQNLRERTKAVAAGSQVQPPPPEKVVFKTIVVYKEVPPPPGRGVRYAAYGVGVLGVAALASGIAFSVLASQAASTVTSGGNPMQPPTFDGHPRDAQESGKTYPIIAGVSYGVAGLCALGGVGLYLFGRKIDREAPKLAFAPSLVPGGGGLAVAGSF